jgi:hypothetical protein
MTGKFAASPSVSSTPGRRVFLRMEESNWVAGRWRYSGKYK